MTYLELTSDVGRAAKVEESLSRIGSVSGDLVGKRSFDLLVTFLALPFLGVFSLVLLVLNPFFNRGPLFYAQTRMGRDCKPFTAIKFRTMQPSKTIERSVDDPLERDRITPLGGFLRKARIDECPQFLNVLQGQMSLIGPRPDYYEHACHFMQNVDGYRERHLVRPGISGLAQTEIGYVEGTEATRAKVGADLEYIPNRSWALELWILWRTFAVVLTRKGS